MSDTSVVIVEGPDGAGKTMLAHKLATRRYLHQGPYELDPLPQSLTLLEQFKERVVLDRFHLGEQVYGPIFRGRDALGGAGRRMLERYLLSRRALVVLALPPLGTAHRNWYARKQQGGEMFADRYEEIYDAFTKVKTLLPTVTYDYTVDTQESFAQKYVNQLPKHLNHGPGVGAFRQGVTLIVGEQCSDSSDPLAFPFIGRGGCSEWLAEQLEEADVDEKNLYWINAVQNDGGQTNNTFVSRLKPARIFALGGVAGDWVRGIPQSYPNAVELRQFNHPQHHKRFKHHEPYDLIEALKS